MVNTEHSQGVRKDWLNYNILNIVVNTEHDKTVDRAQFNYNILNIVVNTELSIVYKKL